MRAVLLAMISICILPFTAGAQAPIRFLIKDAANATLPGAAVVSRSYGATADSAGIAIVDGPFTGVDTFYISLLNYEAQQVIISSPDTVLHSIVLQQSAGALDEVIVSSTRTRQPIESAPTKIEILEAEELEEESSTKPGNIASLLSDLSGVQVQQASATIGISNVRIQGLDGRYTQLLRDGMPLFDGISGGFGITQIPPIDLQQVEVIKGSASTLYGGGAIGGLINFISKHPTTEQQATVILTASTLTEVNANSYFSRRKGKWGYTLFAGITRQSAVDVDGDGLSDVPKLLQLNLHPRIFYYPDEKTTIIAGYSGTLDRRDGGDMEVVRSGEPIGLHQYYERNRVQRHTGELIAEHRFKSKVRGTIKGSVSGFTRGIESPRLDFSGKAMNFYGEASAVVPKQHWDFVGGINVTGDRFHTEKPDTLAVQRIDNTIPGVFVQATAKLGGGSSVEGGLRADYHTKYGAFILPRLAVFYRISPAFAVRAGYGAGYRTPNPLAPQNVDYAINFIRPVSDAVKPERSAGYNLEANYRRSRDKDHKIFINQAFFYTALKDPIIASEQSDERVLFSNAGGKLTSYGFDTYTKLILDAWELYLGYTYTIAERKYLADDRPVALTPRNRAAAMLTWSMEGKWRACIESSYIGSQYRDGDSRTPDYYLVAAMAERKFGPHFSAVLNAENLLDYRQQKYESIYTGSLSAPLFKPLWAPIDGRMINVSLKWAL